MVKGPNGIASYAFPLACALALLVVDICTPEGLNVWLFQLLLFFAFFRQLDRTFLLVVGSCSSVFIIIGLFLPPGNLPLIYGLVDRLVGLILLWTTGVWLMRFKQSQQVLQDMREAYRVSEERLQEVFNSIAVGIIEFDRNDRLTVVNDKVCRILGYSREQLIGAALNELTAPEDQAWSAAIRSRLRDGSLTEADYEKRYLRQDGTLLWAHVTVTPRCDVSGIFMGAVGTIEDISSRKEAEERLATASSLLTALSEATPEPMYVKDRDSRLIFLNPATARAIGKPIGVLLGKNEYDWLDDRQQARVMIENDRHVMETGETQVVEEALTGPQGVRLLLSTKSPLRNQAGKVIGIVAISRDITDQKRAEVELRRSLEQIRTAEEALRKARDELEQRVRERTRELERAYDELQRETAERLAAVEELHRKERLLIQQSRLAAMGEMISNISHQWRQPLNILGLVVQEMGLSIWRGAFTIEDVSASVAKAMQIIATMSQTIDDFRNFFSPDKLTVDFTTREVVEKALSFMEGIFKQMEARIDLVCIDELPVNGLRNEFTQVILNILTNTRDAIWDREVTDPVVTIHLFRENDRAVVTIADNAGGIPSEIIDRVFDPYFTTKGPDRGTGIGLFMSKTIIEKHMGGRLTVCNAGAGALFRIELPGKPAPRSC